MNLKYLKEQYEQHPADLEMKKKYYQTCYEEYKKVDWFTERLEKLAKQNEIPVQQLKDNAAIYACQYLHQTKEEHRFNIYSHNGQNQKYGQRPDSKYNVLLQTLLHIPEENKQEIIEIIDKTGIHTTPLKARIGTFVVGYYPNEKEKIEQILRTKIDIYVNYKNQLRKTEEELARKKRQQQSFEVQFPRAQYYIQEFLKQEFENKSEFLKQVEPSITEREFDNLVKIVQTFDPELFKDYKQKTLRIRDLHYARVLKNAMDVFQLIKSGIPESEKEFREFDIIDYYLISNYPIQKFISLLKEVLPKEELKILYNFYNKNQSSDLIDQNLEKRVLTEEKSYLTSVQNQDGTISQMKITLSSEEKTTILEFMSKNKLPNSYKVYATAVNRYLKGMLPLQTNPSIAPKQPCIKKLTKNNQVLD